jgi:very-short-patch-repair endonuclease
MLKYHSILKRYARKLRTETPESEQALWWRLRGKQLLAVQFYRQKPIGNYIVDFYAPKAKLVVEVDGSQHLEGPQALEDAQRDAYLAGQGLLVLRVSNLQVLQELDAVVAVIFQEVNNRTSKNPP